MGAGNRGSPATGESISGIKADMFPLPNFSPAQPAGYPPFDRARSFAHPATLETSARATGRATNSVFWKDVPAIVAGFAGCQKNLPGASEFRPGVVPPNRATD